MTLLHKSTLWICRTVLGTNRSGGSGNQSQKKQPRKKRRKKSRAAHAVTITVDAVKVIAVPAAKAAVPAAKAAVRRRPRSPSRPSKVRGNSAIMPALSDDGEDRKKRINDAQEQNIKMMMPQSQPQFQTASTASWRSYGVYASRKRNRSRTLLSRPMRGSKPVHDYVAYPCTGGAGLPAKKARMKPNLAAVQNLLTPLVKQKLGDEKFQLYVKRAAINGTKSTNTP